MARLQKRQLPALLVLLSFLWSGISGGGDDDLVRFDQRIKPEDRQHWAFQPVRRSTMPQVKDGVWVRNPVDLFVLEKLEQKGWKPAAPASTEALLRRIYLDLIGIPPT